MRRQRSRLVGGMAFGVVYALARVVEPWPLKVVFDQVLFHKRAHGAWFRAFTAFGHSNYEILIAAAVLLVAAGLVRGMAYYYEDLLLSTAAQEIVYKIRARLYRHLHQLPLAFHQERRAGDTLVRLSADIVVLRDMLVDSVVNIGTGVVLVILMLAVMFAVDPVLTALSLASMPLVVVLSMLYGRRIRDSSRKQRQREGQVAALMHEALAAISVVQLHGAEHREQERFHEVNRRSLKQGIKATRLEARMNRGVELALAAATVVVLWAGTLRALRGAITPGELIVFISYLRGAQRPLRRASKTVQRSAKASAAAERIVELLGTEPSLVDAVDAAPAPRFTGAISFDDVRFAYEEGATVLDGISFSVEPGAIVAIVGSTGSGKSTLLNLVPRLFDPTAGRVTIDGLDLRALTLQSVRNQVSMVQQETVLFGLSIAENIRYGSPDATDEEVAAAAAAAGLADFLAELPDGLDTVLTERGASLSGGQRQRVAIARALIRRTPILLLDEPTTGLDPAARQAVIAALEQLINGTTTLVVTHDMQLARRAAEIVVLEHGRVVVRGPYADLEAECTEFRRLAGLPTPARPPRKPSVARPRKRLFFYSHNGVGIGHLQRQLDLATGYRERHADDVVLLASGSHGASTFSVPAGIDYVKLPSLTKVDGRTWTPRDLPMPLKDVIELRTELLQKTVRKVSPDLLVADFMPAGPYGELLPTLEELERRGGRAVAGFRDVLEYPESVRRRWAEGGIYDVLRRHYAAICVYGDPQMLDFVAAYGLDDELAGRLHYCGYLGREKRPTPTLAAANGRPLIVATGGGGVDGPALAESFIHAAARLRPRLGGTWLAVTGPLMAEDDHARIFELGARRGIAVQRVVPELRTTVASADCVVSMAGYNTVCDILSFRRRSVLVPRAQPSAEQLLRAQRLRDWGIAEVIEADQLHPGSLADAIVHALGRPEPPPVPVALTGLEKALDVFDAVCERRSPARTSRRDESDSDMLLRRAAADLERAAFGRERLADVAEQLEAEFECSDGATDGLLDAARAANELRRETNRDCEAAIAGAYAQAQRVLGTLGRNGDLESATACARGIVANCEEERARLDAATDRLRELNARICASFRSELVEMLETLETRAAPG